MSASICIGCGLAYTRNSNGQKFCAAKCRSRTRRHQYDETYLLKHGPYRPDPERKRDLDRAYLARIRAKRPARHCLVCGVCLNPTERPGAPRSLCGAPSCAVTRRHEIMAAFWARHPDRYRALLVKRIDPETQYINKLRRDCGGVTPPHGLIDMALLVRTFRRIERERGRLLA